jgi:hypothetical protein
MRKCLVLLSLIVAGCGSGAGSGSNESLAGRWQIKNSQWGEAGVNSTVDFEGSVLTIAATAASGAGETAQVIVKGTFAESAGKLSFKATGVDNLGDLGNSKATLGPILAARGLLLVGLDIIGDSLTEINVTSPTCFQEITQQTGFDVPAMFVDALEAAIRSVCEPYFDRPLKEISLGLVLMRLFQTSRRFQVEIQPQLVLLQKTLLNIEGLGRDLDPDLDLWSTAKPFLEKWMVEQVGPARLWAQLKAEAPMYAKLLPALPRLLHQYLGRPANNAPRGLDELLAEQRRTNRLLQGLVYGAVGFLLGLVVMAFISASGHF